MIMGLTEAYGTKTTTQKLESWYGRGITKSMLPYVNRYINYSKGAVDEWVTNYATTTTAPMYTFDYGTRPLRGDLRRSILNLNDDPPEIGDITEDDVDKLLKV